MLAGGEEEVRQGAPRRPRGEGGTEKPWEDLTPEETEDYFEDVVEYLGLDTAALAEAGFVPGTREYLNFVLEEIDAIIRRVIGDANPDDEDFSGMLRSKTEKDLQDLRRALYVRGQLGSFVGPGSYEDPFTGIMEDVAAPEGARFQPGVAAYQRGIARKGEELAGKRGEEAKGFLRGMLGGNPDIYGMQAKMDARALREAFETRPMSALKRKRRGMFGEPEYFRSELESMAGPDLDKMLALLMGGDTGRQGAAIDELFGLRPE
jgi:hypothetical protein